MNPLLLLKLLKLLMYTASIPSRQLRGVFRFITTKPKQAVMIVIGIIVISFSVDFVFDWFFEELDKSSYEYIEEHRKVEEDYNYGYKD